MSTAFVRRRRAAVVIFFVLLLAMVIGAVGIHALAAQIFAGAGSQPCDQGPQCEQKARTSRLGFGVALPTKPVNVAELAALTTAVGEAPSIISTYEAFGDPFPAAELRLISSHGATPLVTWEPWKAGKGTHQPTFSLRRIASGAFDSELSRWASGFAAYRQPVLLRFAHEMNGTWYPWGWSVNGNEAADYVHAWRHVHDVVSKAGAKNLKWVWNPNVSGGGQVSDMEQFYPGSSYVDTVGLDGYNWGTTGPGQRWTGPEALFSNGIDRLRAIAPGKPLLIGETASAEQGGSKAKWITALLPYLSSQPDISAFVWFDINKEANWSLSSSSESLEAFRRALAAR